MDLNERKELDIISKDLMILCGDYRDLCQKIGQAEFNLRIILAPRMLQIRKLTRPNISFDNAIVTLLEVVEAEDYLEVREYVRIITEDKAKADGIEKMIEGLTERIQALKFMNRGPEL